MFRVFIGISFLSLYWDFLSLFEFPVSILISCIDLFSFFGFLIFIQILSLCISAPWHMHSCPLPCQ